MTELVLLVPQAHRHSLVGFFSQELELVMPQLPQAMDRLRFPLVEHLGEAQHGGKTAAGHALVPCEDRKEDRSFFGENTTKATRTF